MFKHQDMQIFCLKLKIMINFRPFEVVGWGSETQIQVSENLNYLIQHFVSYILTKWCEVKYNTRKEKSHLQTT